MGEPAVGSLRKLLCTPSHQSSSEGRRLSLGDFNTSLVSRIEEGEVKEKVAVPRVPGSVWISGLHHCV